MTKRFLLQVLLAVWLPALLLSRFLEIAERNGRERLQDRLGRQMAEVLRRVGERGNLQKRLNAHLDRITAPPATGKTLVRRLLRLHRDNPGVIDLHLFSAGGKYLQLPGLPKAPGFAARRFLEAILDEQANISPKLLEAFGGNPRAPRLLAASPGKLVELMNGNRQTWGGWWALQGKKGRGAGHLVAFVHRGGIEPERLLDRAVEETTRIVRKEFLIGWQDPADPDRLRPAATGFPEDLPRQLSGQTFGEDRFINGSCLGVTHRLESGELLFCLSIQSHGMWEKDSTVILVNGGRRAVFPLAAVLTSLLWLFQTGRLTRYGGLRTRLSLLFLLAGGIPLLVLTVTALIDREDREHLLIDRFIRQQQTALARIDGDFFSEFDRLKDRYYRVLRSLDPTDPAGWSQGLQRLSGLAFREKGLILRIFAVDLSGKLLFYDHGFGPVGESRQTRESMRIYALNFLKKITGKTERDRKSVDSAILDLLATDLSRGYQHAGSDMQVQTINNQVLLTFVSFLSDKKKKIQAAFLAQHSSRLAQIRYVRRWMRRWGRPGPEDPRLLAVPAVSAALWPAFPNDSTGMHEGLARLRDQAVSTQLPCSDVIRIGGRDYLVSGVPGQNLEGYVLMLAEPIEIIREKTRQLNLRLAGLSLVMLILGLGMARLTSALLLKPVADLGRGLEALQQGDFTRTVPTGRVEELARMAERLQLIGEDLHDLQIARTVQEQLWPEKGLRGEEWEIDGASRCATDLGGDHYDWFLLPDGRLVVAVGDVAGHGIPAALVAAAVKVELALQARRETSPAAILAAISHGLHEQMGRERTMSLWLGLFDPATRNLRYAAAGHPPALLLTNGEATEIGTMGFPLAAMKQPTYREGEIRLPAPSRLFVYTDGLVEARNRAGELLGYGGLHRLAMALSHVNCGRLVSQLLDTVQDWTGRQTLEDDQTFVVLEIGENASPSPGAGTKA